MPEPVRYIVESIKPKHESFFRDLGISTGDTIDVPDGFPEICDHPEPGEPVTLIRELHPNLSWFLRTSADEGMVELRRVWSLDEVTQ